MNAGTECDGWNAVTEDFPAEVQSVVGPVLADLGFTLDEVDEDVDEGGRKATVVHYRASDCKIQIYRSAREGSVNSMIAPLDAPNQIGIHDRSYKWQYLTRFAPPSDVPLEELVKSVHLEPQTDTERLARVRQIIAENFEAAHRAIAGMNRNK